MRRGARRVGVVVVVLVLTACGGGGGKSSLAARRERARGFEVTGSVPSVSSRMICAAEGKSDIAKAVGVDTVRALVGRWSNHRYSGRYTYGEHQSMMLSVKELSSAAATTRYFDMLGATLGRLHPLSGLGQGA